MLNRLCFPPKLVSVLCVIQVTIIILGVLLTGVFLKLEGTIYEASFAPAAVQLVRFHGIWFLLLPLSWSGWAILRNRRQSRVIELDQMEAWVGLMFTAGIVLFFSWTTVRALGAAYGWRPLHMMVFKEQ